MSPWCPPSLSGQGKAAQLILSSSTTAHSLLAGSTQGWSSVCSHLQAAPKMKGAHRSRLDKKHRQVPKFKIPFIKIQQLYSVQHHFYSVYSRSQGKGTWGPGTWGPGRGLICRYPCKTKGKQWLLHGIPQQKQAS